MFRRPPRSNRTDTLFPSTTPSRSADRVYFPARLVEEALRSAAREVLLAGRTPAHDLHLGGPRVYMGTGGQAVKILDLDGKVRETRLSDNYDIGRPCDPLDHLHFYMRPVAARDLATHQPDVNPLSAWLDAPPKPANAPPTPPQQAP